MIFYKLNFFLLITLLINLNLSAQIYKSSNKQWSVEIKYIEPGTINIFSSPSEDSKVVGHYYYLDKILILNDINTYVKFGWAKVIYPYEGFVLEKSLLNSDEKKALDKRFKNNPDDINSTQNWEPRILTCNKEYSFIKNGNDFDKETLGIIREDEEVLAINKDGLKNKEWIKIYFPKKGFLFAKDLDLLRSNSLLGIGLSYGFVNIPYEKNMENYKNPIGGFIEYSKTNWDFVFRIGFSRTQTHLKEYILQTDLFYLHIQYSFLHLFNRHIRFYALAGGGFWKSKFQFTKYPSLTDYFPEEHDKGFGYCLGGGLEYSLSHFFIGVQYSFLNTEEATFGPDPTPDEFTNQYKLFIGTNQVEVDLGYRFEF